MGGRESTEGLCAERVAIHGRFKESTAAPSRRGHGPRGEAGSPGPVRTESAPATPGSGVTAARASWGVSGCSEEGFQDLSEVEATGLQMT